MNENCEELERDSILQIVLDYLIINNFNSIRADIYGYNCPSKIFWTESSKGYTPDISCIKDKKKHIFRIETVYSLHNEANEKIWKLFAANAKDFDKEFHLIIPNNTFHSVKKRLIEKNINAEVEEINKFCKILI